MKVIDQNTWDRKEIFDLFSAADYPFYSITIPVDMTKVKEVSKNKGISFYYLMIWVCTKAVNSVPNFLLRVRDGQVVMLDQTNPSFTYLKKGSELFQIITMPWEEDYMEFCRHAKERSEAQTGFLDQEKETDELIYFSCTPWFDFTALTNEHKLDKDDTVPHLAWGRYYEEQGRLMVHLSVEVNHRTVDGFHVGKLKECIDREIDALG